tara:strand:+ start:93 stop:398 length:306 start_codon:yes stop_codon:yes gene_type:complete
VATLKHNITGQITQELLAAGDGIDISSITLANAHASDSVNVSLYIEKQNFGRFFLVKSLKIPYGVSVVLDSDLVNFENNKAGFGLYIQLSAASSAVDVIIK